MIKIHETVREVLYSDEEALYALSKGFMNLTAYGTYIKKKVEEGAMKGVKVSGIVVALSRIQKEVKSIHPLVQEIKINNLTTKSPLSEIVFEKNSSILGKLSSLYQKIKTGGDDFLTMTLSTSDITIICSDRIKEKILKHFGDKPVMVRPKLACIAISFDFKYYDMPNITFSLIRRIAQKRIVLAETISNHTEVIFVFHQKYLSEITALFEPK